MRHILPLSLHLWFILTKSTIFDGFHHSQRISSAIPSISSLFICFLSLFICRFEHICLFSISLLNSFIFLFIISFCSFRAIVVRLSVPSIWLFVLCHLSFLRRGLNPSDTDLSSIASPADIFPLLSASPPDLKWWFLIVSFRAHTRSIES